jgi:cholest-4-en-3-one 26-monooxygenase
MPLDVSLQVDAAPDILTAQAFAAGPPHDYFDFLRSNDPVHKGFTSEGRRVWSLLRHDDIRAVSNDVARFTNTRGAAYNGFQTPKGQNKDLILAAEPPHHTRLRYFFNLAFAPRITRQFEPWIRSAAKEIVEALRTQEGEFELLMVVAGQLPAMVIGTILGMPMADRGRMLPWAQGVMRSSEATREALEFAAATSREIIDYAIWLRDEKRRSPGDDMVSVVANAEHEGIKITDSEYFEFVRATIVAGFETTFTAIGQCLLYMIRNPATYRDFRENHRDIMETALVELVRYITPAMQMSRHAVEPVEIRGRKIETDEEVILWYVAANRDPEIFGRDRHEVNLRRKIGPYASFGAGGPHFCIGNQLARLEMRVLFEELFNSGLWFELAGEPRLMDSVMINGLRSVPVRIAAAH